MTEADASGVITTLYSFKGGVGRTMAVANVAFTAAMSGLRVLVMDWDLEAPGMAYYFRGLGEPEQSRAIRAAPGVMDLVWGWRRRIGEAANDEDVDAFLDDYAQGDPFLACIRPVLGEDRLPTGARLDILGPGCRQIDEQHSYAEALARFSWSDFFDLSFGGLFIERLRAWAKSNYDIVLVDSRTGYADVASVCSVQLPDVVALAFIYNRQNLEGVTNVADSIRAQRGSDVRLRAIPMRLSREGTLDEAEARAKAIREFTRNGAFSEEAIRNDLDRLPIRSALGIPFYETIAAMMPVASSAELLTIDYRRLAEALCERPLVFPEIDEAWRAAVARRLEPRTVSVDYLEELDGADPVRIAEEIDLLLDGALEAEIHDDHLEREYIERLISTGVSLSDRVFDEIPADELMMIADKALNLARSEFDIDPLRWAATYVDALMEYDDQFGPGNTPEDRRARLEDFDQILAQGPWNADILLRRARLRREILSLTGPDDEDGFARIEEAMSFLAGVVDPEHINDAAVERAALLLIQARLHRIAKNILDARVAARDALNTLMSLSPLAQARASRLVSETHLLLANLSQDPEMAADHVLAAADSSLPIGPVLSELASATTLLLRSEHAADRAVAFTRRLMTRVQPRGSQSPGYFFSRSPAMASILVSSLTRLFEAISALDTEEATVARDAIIRNAAACLDLIRRRPLPHSATRQRELFKLLAETSGLIQIASEVVPRPAALRELSRATAQLDAQTSEVDEQP